DTSELLSIIEYAYVHMEQDARNELTQLNDAFTLRDHFLETYLRQRYESELQNPEINTTWPLACFEELLSIYAVAQCWWEGPFPEVFEEDRCFDWRPYPEDPPLVLCETALKLGLWVFDDTRHPRYRFSSTALRDFFSYRAGVRKLEEGRGNSAPLQEYREFVQADIKVWLRPYIRLSRYDLLLALCISGDLRVVSLLKSALLTKTYSPSNEVVQALQSFSTSEAKEVIRQWEDLGSAKPTL
ncbi:MAG: hypothetical protein ABI700_02375, partial [Chloroflexota bacterium]